MTVASQRSTVVQRVLQAAPVKRPYDLPAIQIAEELRLHANVTPLYYKLCLRLHADRFGESMEQQDLVDLRTTACIRIRIKVAKPTPKIELHASFMDIVAAALITEDGSAKRPLKHSFFSMGKAVFEDGAEIGAGSYTLQIDYSGLITSKLRALYRAYYKDDDSKHRYMIVSQMCPLDARRVAPCFDEPIFKAEWHVSVIHPSNATAVSNCVVESKEQLTELPGWTLTTFKKTPRMSSYLLAFVLSDFSHIEAKTTRGTCVRVFSRPNTSTQVSFALEASVKALEFFEAFCNIPFPLEKQDMFAIPDFTFGAMENWGLVTYREASLLWDPVIGTSQEKRRVAQVIAHELAHQWFGNLVTMKFWDDVWLNEGFASFMQFFGMDSIDKNFRVKQCFLEYQNIAFDADSNSSALPLSCETTTEQKIEESFSDLVYKKGASVISMMYHVLTKEKFIAAFQKYLAKYAYSNATSELLWQAFGEEANFHIGENVTFTEFARGWTNQVGVSFAGRQAQVGFPLVTVRRIAPCKFELSQKRYAYAQKLSPTSPVDDDKAQWHVPVFYKFKGDEEDDKKLYIECPTDDFPILNYESRCYFRVCYGDEGYVQMLERIKNEELDVITRTRMISDAFACARCSAISFRTALRFEELLTAESEHLPMAQLCKEMHEICGLCGNAPELAVVQRALQRKLTPLCEGISLAQVAAWDRDLALSPRAEFHLQQLRLEAKVNGEAAAPRYLAEFRANVLAPAAHGNKLASLSSRVDPLLRQLVYAMAIYAGDDAEFDQTWRLYLNETNEAERLRLLTALCFTKNEVKLKELFLKAIDVSNREIRLQDVKTVALAIAESPVGSKSIVRMFLDNLDFIKIQMCTTPREFSTLVQVCLDGLTEQQMPEAVELPKKHPLISHLVGYERALFNAQVRHRWRKEFGELTAAYFREQLQN